MPGPRGSRRYATAKLSKNLKQGASDELVRLMRDPPPSGIKTRTLLKVGVIVVVSKVFAG
jgi:hypothetical protein